MILNRELVPSMKPNRELALSPRPNRDLTIRFIRRVSI